MMHASRFRPEISVLAALLLSLVPFNDATAQAQLFVHPTLIMFSGDHRNDVVYVVNQGNATGVFELE